MYAIGTFRSVERTTDTATTSADDDYQLNHR
jgi:hypothetical protein